MNTSIHTAAANSSNSIVGAIGQSKSIKSALSVTTLVCALALSACGKPAREMTTAERTKAIAQSEVSTIGATTDGSAPKTAQLSTPPTASSNTVSTK